MIDLSDSTLIRGDWNRSDATATDNTNALMDIIQSAKASDTGEGVADFGGTNGNTISQGCHSAEYQRVRKRIHRTGDRCL